MAAADGPELDGRDAGAQERDGVGGAVAADAHHLRAVKRSGGVAERTHEDRVRIDDRGRAKEARDDLGAGQITDLLEDRVRVLLRQVANVDIDDASVGHLVEGVAAEDAAEVDRRSVEELGALARKR